MKKLVLAVVACMITATLVGCGSEQQSAGGSESTPAPANEMEAIIAETQADFSATSQKLLDEQEKLFSQVGDTYEGYLQNIESIQAWYDLAVSETESLADRAVEQGRKYYQAVVDNVDVTDDRELEKAKEGFYDEIYEDAWDDYYDAIYEDAFDEMHDAYYDGILDEAFDVIPYEEAYDVSSDAYDAYSDARSDVYDAYSDGKSDLYDDYSDVTSAFWDNDFDIEGLFGPVETVDKSSVESTAEDSSSESTSSSADGVSPEFKASMDEYEEFFDEYVEIMLAYKENPTSTEVLSKYADFMSQYSKTMQAFEDIQSEDLSAADAAYYAEVSGRVMAKIAEVAY